MSQVPAAALAAAQAAIVTAGTTYYLSLNTADPGATGANEGTGLTRQAITFGSPTSATPSVQSSTDSQSFPGMPGGATYGYFSVWTAATGGSFVRGGQLNTAITPAAQSSVTVATGQIYFQAA
ncbi:hypothetical protein K6U06_06635 [Acidiferrimicrobium sp. IK]|uniref:phage tail fiber protein n=1 Tax=Acidiferrimicrobium sp. IK TaxID=2871700 RepID=UPI0021CB3D51|nr:hypothetical protein [Acidiferrimicrobium sp. IK]MCU4184030.1 hypothetical protein [Acidiferrimicrobium sp. IK]